MTETPNQAVVFDLDDTLYSERDYVRSGFTAVAAAFEHVLGPPEESAQRMWELFDADRRALVFNEILAARGRAASADVVQAMLECYRHHEPTLELLEDARAALGKLRERYRLGIITDGRVSTQSLKIRALGLERKMHHIIITDALGAGYGKPHPMAFEQMAAQLGCRAADCTYVADNPVKDFVAPNALGWNTVQIVRPEGLYKGNDPPDGGTPQIQIESLLELPMLR